MLSPVRLSVCRSVRRYYHIKTVEVKIMKFSPYGSPNCPIALVFTGKVASKNSKGFPQAGASNKEGVGKISSFLSLTVNISKTVADRLKLQLMTNRKSHMDFPLLTLRLMTLDDLEGQILLELRDISRVSEAITAKRMNIDPYCQRRNCSPLKYFSAMYRLR